jgi:hypothetical protein
MGRNGGGDGGDSRQMNPAFSVHGSVYAHETKPKCRWRVPSVIGFVHAILMEVLMPRFTQFILTTFLTGILTAMPVTIVLSFPSPEKSPEEKAQDNIKDAMNAYNKGVDKQKKAFTHFEKGDTTKAMKELEKAVKEYEKAVSLNDSFPEALSNLGYCLRNLGNYSKALEVYDRALKLKPDFPEAIEYRAVAYLWLGRMDEAKSEYQRLLKIDSTEAAELKVAIEAAESGKLKKGKW